MDSSDRVSIVALLVSLIALIVALLQALQQYSATADGYRHCAESVIGPWHKTRRRRPVPSEFRFETIYDAPFIRLLTFSEYAGQIKNRHSKRVHLLYPLSKEPCCEGERLLIETVHPSKESPEGWLAHFPKWTGLRGTSGQIQADDDDEKGRNLPRMEHEEPSSALVSWISFLRALHLTYSLYDQAINEVYQRTPWSSPCLNDGPNHEPDRCDWCGWDRSNPTQPVVDQQTIQWDFRGGNVTLPVAQTRLGDIILFALRMGMQWRRIEVESSTLMAVGNGYSLSSANRSGLIVTFTSTRVHDPPRSIVPSQYADKFLFGILPGDPDLVKRDFSMVGRRGEIYSAESIFKTILELNGLRAEDDRIDLGTLTAGHDLKKLLCPFLLQPYSASATVRFVGWPFHRAESFLHYYESRVAFLQQLSDEVIHDPHQYTEQDVESLRHVKAQLDQLKDNHASDFYCIDFTPRYTIQASGANKVSDSSILFGQICESIFKNCTESLEKHAWGQKIIKSHEDSSTRYVLLVAAHTIMTKNAIDKADQEFHEAEDLLRKRITGRRLRSSDWAEAIQLERQAPVEAREYHLRNPHFYFRMKRIVQDMKSEDRGIRQELAKFRVEVTDAEAQLAWWMMMIRGIAWDMSCYREPWPADELPVPSTFYGDPTPVMLA
ncbi:hypothetical protein Daus18300_007261 [Diaporthe australafricana]|uniref:Uncharacterized protein n=1 Tax=Diaporthe australafricana TaxID=127596 RepID=A0ABR3WNX8_9PEZI